MIVQTLGGYSPEPAHLTTLQVCLGGVAVFGVAMIAVRFAARRPLSEAAPLYMVLGVLLGASLSQTLPGPSPIIPAMICAALIALVGRLIGRESVRRIAAFLRNQRGAWSSGRSPAPDPTPNQAFRFEGGSAHLHAVRFVPRERGSHASSAFRRQM